MSQYKNGNILSDTGKSKKGSNSKNILQQIRTIKYPHALEYIQQGKDPL